MTTISLRINDQLKHIIQKQAKELGLSMNQFINLKLEELKTQDGIYINLR